MLLTVLRARRLRAELVFHSPVPDGTTQDKFDFASLAHKAVGEPFALAFNYFGFWDLRVSAADAYRSGNFSSRATPPTAIRPTAAMASTPVSRTPGTWAGNLLPNSRDGAGRHCSSPTKPSAGRSFCLPQVTSSSGSLRKTVVFLERYSPERDAAEFVAAWTGRSTGAAEVMALEPNYAGSPIIFATGCPSAQGDHNHRATPGHHPSSRTLSDGRKIYEMLGTSFTSFADDKAFGDKFSRAADRIGTLLDIVATPPGDLKEAFGSDAVLVRPDQFGAEQATPPARKFSSHARQAFPSRGPSDPSDAIPASSAKLCATQARDRLVSVPPYGTPFHVC